MLWLAHACPHLPPHGLWGGEPPPCQDSAMQQRDLRLSDFQDCQVGVSFSCLAVVF